METDQSPSQTPALRSRRFVAGAGLVGLVSLLTGCPSTTQTRPEPVQQNGFAWYTQGEVQAGTPPAVTHQPVSPVMTRDPNGYNVLSTEAQANRRGAIGTSTMYDRNGEYLGGRQDPK